MPAALQSRQRQTVTSSRTDQRATARAVAFDALMRTGLASDRATLDSTDQPRELNSSALRTVPPALRERLVTQLADAVHFARRHWGKPFRMPTLDYSLRGKAAGTASGHDWNIALNATLLAENPEAFAKDTLLHELAHLLTFALYGAAATPHGRHWKSVMRALGAEPTRTHDLDVLNSAVGELLYKYRCHCSVSPWTPKRHAAAAHSTRVCLKCHHTMVYAGELRRSGVWMKDPRGLHGGEPRAIDPTSLKKRRAVARKPSLAGARPSTHFPTARPSPMRTPPASTPTHSRFPPRTEGPSAALQQYALDLARKLTLELGPAQLGSREILSRFVEHARVLVAAGAVAIAGSSRLPAVSGRPRPAPAVDDNPTDRQVSYARSIASSRGVVIAADVLNSRRALSRWIDANR